MLMDTFLSGAWGRELLLEYVFLEVMTVLLLRCDLATATRVGQILLEAQELEFVPCSDVFAQTVEKFATQKGTHLSFVDSAIAVVAEKRAGGLLLTFDEEFRKLPGLRFPELTAPA